MGTWSEYLPIGSKDIGVTSGVGAVRIPSSYDGFMSLDSIKGNMRFYQSGEEVDKANVDFNVTTPINIFGVQNTVNLAVRSKNRLPNFNEGVHSTTTPINLTYILNYTNNTFTISTEGVINEPTGADTGIDFDIYDEFTLPLNQRFIFSGMPESLRDKGVVLVLIEYDANYNGIRRFEITGDDEIEFTSTSSSDYVYYLGVEATFRHGESYNGVISPMIRFSGLGDKTPSLYQSDSTYSFYFDPLFRIDDVYDEICKRYGEWVLMKRIEDAEIARNTTDTLWEPMNLSDNKRAWLCKDFLAASDALSSPERYLKAYNGKILCDVLPVYDDIAQLAEHNFGIVSVGASVLILPTEDGVTHKYYQTAKDFCGNWLDNYAPRVYYETAKPQLRTISEPASGTGLSHPRKLDMIPYKGNDTIVMVTSVAYVNQTRTMKYATPELCVSYVKTEQGEQQIVTKSMCEAAYALCDVHDRMLNGCTLRLLTQAEYNNLSTYDSHTLYFIIES